MSDLNNPEQRAHGNAPLQRADLPSQDKRSLIDVGAHSHAPATPLTNLRNPREALANLKPYSGEMPKGKLILAANESPYNLPEPVREKIAEATRDFDFNRYPDPLATKLRAQIAEANAVSPDCVLVGNGGDELLLDIMLAWGGSERVSVADSSNHFKSRTMLQFSPTFSMYQIYARALDTKVVTLPRNPESMKVDVETAVTRLRQGDIDLCFVDNPNNPSGSLMTQEEICKLLEASDALIVVDEAYFEFAGVSMLSYLDRYPNMVILRTFSKAYSLAGLRLGYVLANPQVIDMLARVRMPYSVNSFSQMVGELVMNSTKEGEFDQTIADIKTERDWIFAALADMPSVEVWQSQANYLLFRLDGAKEVWQRLLDVHDIYIRDFSSAPELTDCLRVTVGTREQNIRFVTALRESIAVMNLPDNFSPA